MYVESYKHILMPWPVKGNNLYIPHYCTKTDKLHWSVNIQGIKCWRVKHRSCTVTQHSISAVQDLRINIKRLKTSKNKTKRWVSKKSVNLLQPSHNTPHSWWHLTRNVEWSWFNQVCPFWSNSCLSCKTCHYQTKLETTMPNFFQGALCLKRCSVCRYFFTHNIKCALIQNLSVNGHYSQT